MIKYFNSSCFKFQPSLLIIGLFSTLACKQEPVDQRIYRMEASKVAEMASDVESLVQPEIADGLQLKLWAVDSLIADPISIQVDDHERLFYTRTVRQKNSEFDIRGHQDWEIESISLQTIDDKRAFLHKVLSPENSEKNDWLTDVNGDGSRDWRDMTIEKERVYRLEDTDGDGLADFSQLMVEDFNDEVTDIAGGVLSYNDELFVAVGPDLWRMKDKNGDGIMDEKESISHGYGIHIGFSGHNMSGLEVGPDGRIYWSMGDIGFNGVGPDGKEWKYPNEGVIVRSNPDGSDFEVFAHGLRNVHEFVFDEYANLISVDNDGDHGGESERLVYVVNGSDTGWRTNWQFGKYRDPLNNTYKVWMEEGLYKPRFEGQAAYITPTITNYINGPTGMVYNPGTALSPRWKNTFFVVEFVGNPSRSGIHAFKLNPKGAGFELAETNKILGGILPTGLDFGPDGSLFVADWIDGWGTKDSGRVWKLDDEEGSSWEERAQTKELVGQDFTAKASEDLDLLLKNPDMRIRRKAQFELAKRGEEGAAVLRSNAEQQENQLARIHGIIGLSQMARLEDENYAEPLLALLKDNDPEIRAQAAKWLGDIRYQRAGEALLPLLQDDNSRTKFFAAEALGRIAYEPAIPSLVQLLGDNNDEDVYIRHAASLALGRINKAEPLVALSNHASPAVRLGAVLALRRMAHPGIANFLNDQDEYIVTEAARAINDDYSIEAALPALGDLLKNTNFTNEALIRRSINANLRVGTREALNNLIAYAEKETAPVAMRREALQSIGTWTKPSVLDRVDGRFRGEITRELAPVQQATSTSLSRLLSHQEPQLRLEAAKVMGQLKISEGVPGLLAKLKNDRNAEVKIASLHALVVLEGDHKNQAIEQALSDQDKNVRVAGLDLLSTLDIPKDLMVNLINDVIEKRTTEEKQAAVLTLGAIPLEYAQAPLEALLSQLEAGTLAPEIELELSEAIEASGSQALSARYEQHYAGLSSDSLLASYEGSLYGGDAELGGRVFFRNQAAQCIRCHAYDDMGGVAGPRLNGIANKISRRELLESMIDPGKRLAPGFGIVTLELDNGKTLSGILSGETDSRLTLKIGNQPDTVLLKTDVVNRTNAPSSMPDMKQLMTRREIRDVVSFLATLTKEWE
jgi:quinoprotein glucose dehydrogenase